MITAAVLAAAAAIGVHYEGERTTAYSDAGGVPTICYGHTQGVKAGDTATHDQCVTWLKQEMGDALETVQQCINKPMTLGQMAAFTDAVYNVGPKIMCGSTLQRKFNAGDATGACHELSRWVYADGNKLRGLEKRRATEMKICLGEPVE